MTRGEPTSLSSATANDTNPPPVNLRVHRRALRNEIAPRETVNVRVGKLFVSERDRLISIILREGSAAARVREKSVVRKFCLLKRTKRDATRARS